MKFDHIGIVVGDIAEGRLVLTAMIGIERWTEVFEEAGVGVFAQFGIGEGGVCYELISPRGPDSPVSGALRKGMNILNHIAFLVHNLDSAASTLAEFGCVPVVEPKPAAAFDGNLVQFFQSPFRFLIELIEAPEFSRNF